MTPEKNDQHTPPELPPGFHEWPHVRKAYFLQRLVAEAATLEQLSEQINMPIGSIRRFTNLCNLPQEIQDALAEGAIKISTADKLSKKTIPPKALDKLPDDLRKIILQHRAQIAETTKTPGKTPKKRSLEELLADPKSTLAERKSAFKKLSFLEKAEICNKMVDPTADTTVEACAAASQQLGLSPTTVHEYRQAHQKISRNPDLKKQLSGIDDKELAFSLVKQHPDNSPDPSGVLGRIKALNKKF